MERQAERVLVIGIDGATFDLIKPWASTGHLPTLARLLDTGTHATLLSTHQSNSAQAWSSFITGKNAGSHGIYDFVSPVPGTYDVRFVSSALREGKSLWRLLSEADKRVGVMNVPITYPPEAVNGFLISGLDAPGVKADGFYPPGLLDEVEHCVGPYILESGAWGYIRRGRYDLALEKLHKSVDQRLAAASYLMTHKAWDFFMVVFTATDRVQHHFWKFMNPEHPNYDPKKSETYGRAIFGIYQKVDHAVESLINLAGDDVTVIIMSDHGAGPSTHRTFFINRWLAQEGFLHFAASDGNLKNRFQSVGSWGLRKADLLAKRFLSRSMKERLVRAFPSLRNRVDSTLYITGIDWTHTKIYSRENAPTLWVNLRGREPKGVVQPGAEYERCLDEVIERLLGVRCPETGKPIVGRVFKKSEIYHGKHLDSAPDLLVSWKDDAYIQRPGYTGRGQLPIQILRGEDLQFAEKVSRPSGIHRQNGVLLIQSRSVQKRGEVTPAHITDLAPTILYLMGLPIPTGMDGRLLEVLFTREHLEAQPPVYTDEVEETSGVDANRYDAGEAKHIEERLRGLGYID
jgi:predicted AlkP superfamily phosphohydrolase/phosphomutase